LLEDFPLEELIECAKLVHHINYENVDIATVIQQADRVLASLKAKGIEL